MASLLSHDVLELPQDIVTSSPGLAFDIGSSIAKIVYRSNKEYRRGKPLGDELPPTTGRVHLAKFLRENTDDVLAFIEENCDFIRDEDGIAHISATGVGGSQFKAHIEEKLKIKIKVLAEFDCFVKTFKKLSSTLSKEELLYPMPAKGVAEAERFRKIIKDWSETAKGLSEATIRLEEDDTVDEQEDSLPCALVMSGSGVGMMHIKADGSYQILEGIYTGGRTFLGLVAASTGEKNFDKMLKMAAESDGRTATTFISDMKSEKPETEKDIYNAMTSVDFPLFQMGKVCTSKREDVKDGDIIQSIYQLFTIVHEQIVALQCMLLNVKKAYFCGNFIENEVARTNIMMYHITRDLMVPADKRVDFQFLRNGGVYGALGAFFVGCEASSDSPATATEDTAL